MKYQPEIDGLRALSVALVVLFHAGLPVPGGYVGVDVFFVISGYLITGLILKDLRAGSFSLAGFWDRRIRRILPASLAVTLGVLTVAAILMLPRDFAAVGYASFAQGLMAINFYFWRNLDYFASTADTNPLLHMWSLAVEEQFYFFYPPLLMFLHRVARNRLQLILFVLAITGFALSVFGVALQPRAAFYLLPFRAWELLLGAVMAFESKRRKTRRWMRESLMAMGVILIMLGAIFFDRRTPFPGIASLLPCLGAAMFIHGAREGEATISRIFRSRPIVFLGLISYSFYLCHWPVMAFANYLLIEPFWGWSLGMIGISLVLAVISWRFVETPFRAKQGHENKRQSRLSSRQTVFLAATLALLTVLAVSAAILATDGFPSRMPVKVRELVDDATWNGSNYIATADEVREGEFRLVGDASRNDTSFLVWGDSHGLMYSECIDKMARELNLKGRFVARGGIPPIPGVWRENQRANLEAANRIASQIIRSRVPNVVLIARWSLYLDGYSAAELRFEEKGKDAAEGLVRDLRVTPKTSDSALLAAKANLSDFVRRLTDQGVQVWCLTQVPEQEGPIAISWYFHKVWQLKFRFAASDWKDYQKRQSNSQKLMDHLVTMGVRVVPSERFMFDSAGSSYLILDGRACYRDNDHLSRFGVSRLMEPCWRELFGQIRRTTAVTVSGSQGKLGSGQSEAE